MSSVIVARNGTGWRVLAGGEEFGPYPDRETAEEEARDRSPLGTTLIIDRRTAHRLTTDTTIEPLTDHA